MSHKLTDKDVEILNSPKALYRLLKHKHYNIHRALHETKMVEKISKEQEDLIQLQNWVINNNKKVVVLFEGRDAAGKTGAIRRITQHINPRYYRIVALNVPTEDERHQWYFQRYIKELPKPGEIVFFDRSWYNRAVVEPVNNFCTKEEYKRFMEQVNDFERMIIDADTYLIKLYFSITREEQQDRFKEIEEDPLTRWKINDLDLKAQKLWDNYSKYKEKMFKHTDSELAPWKIIDANDKLDARLHSIKHILKSVPFVRENDK